MIAPWRNEKFRRAYERPELKASLEIILSIFSITILLALAIRPTLGTIAQLQKKIEDQTIVDSRLSTKISQLIKANADLSTYAGKLFEYSDAVTDTPDQSGVAKRIEVLALGSRVRINSLSFEPIPLVGQKISFSGKEKVKDKPSTDKDGKIASFGVSYEVIGGQQQVLSFIRDLENMDRLVHVTEVSIKKIENTVVQGENKNTLRMIGKATAYYVLQKNP